MRVPGETRVGLLGEGRRAGEGRLWRRGRDRSAALAVACGRPRGEFPGALSELSFSRLFCAARMAFQLPLPGVFVPVGRQVTARSNDALHMARTTDARRPVGA